MGSTANAEEHKINTENLSETADSHAGLRFSQEEEMKLLHDAESIKVLGNKLFVQGRYDEALQQYHQALGNCPAYLDFDIAVLQSNVAACHLKQEQWNEAVEWATKSLGCIESLTTLHSDGSDNLPEEDAQAVEDAKPSKGNGNTSRVELDLLAQRGIFGHHIGRIQAKVLLRRAKGREGIGSWAALQGAEEDYRRLLTLQLTSLDRENAVSSLARMPAKLNAAKQREVNEMMGKLKQLGNGMLRPFGLSTDNFSMIKDDKTGGYSLQFNQNR